MLYQFKYFIICSIDTKYNTQPKTRYGPNGICDDIVLDLFNKLGIAKPKATNVCN